MKVSFVIPALNEEAFIGKALLSIISAVKQSPFETEIIVIDNGSTDNTAKIASGFPGVKVFSEPKRGTNHARQRGFLESSGDLIANIDADNVLPPRWMKSVFAHFSSQPELVALSGPYIFADLSATFAVLTRLYYWFAYPVYVIGNRYFKKGGAVMGGNLVMRRKALEDIGGYNTDLTFYGDDTDTAARMSKVGLVKFDYKFVIYSSGRRFKKEGTAHAIFRYVINHVWVSLWGKSFHKNFPKIK